MSSNDGIYVCKTSCDNGWEYRVADLPCPAIDNADYYEQHNMLTTYEAELCKLDNFKKCQVFHNMDDAVDYGIECGPTEYGITVLTFRRKFPTEIELRDFQNVYNQKVKW